MSTYVSNWTKKGTTMVETIIAELFYENPTKNYHIREISRITKIPKSTVAKKIKQLIQENIVREEKDIFKSYKSTDPDINYRRKKMLHAINKINSSGLIEHIQKQANAKCIILFGSTTNGEYTKESDIDIFVNAKQQKIILKKYEEQLNKKIQLFFSEDIKRIPENMKNSIANGIIISGYAKFF